MVFELRQNILATDGSIWVGRGTYSIVDLFDNQRILINVGGNTRQLVLVPLWKGTVHRNGK
jgi:hypothetical protein